MARKKPAAETTVETKPAPVIAYKAFDPDMKCRDFQFEVGRTYEMDGQIELCCRGFHACTVPFDCWSYYPHSTELARVVYPDGIAARCNDDSKVVGDRITIDARLTIPDWIKAHVATVMELCKAATGALVSAEKECAAATGYSGHAAATGDRGHAAATGNSGHAAATGYSGHAAATGYSGHAAATGDRGHAAATGDRGHAAATGASGHAAATGYGGHAAATGYGGHAAATGDRGHAAATGDSGHAAATGKHGIAASLGVSATAQAGPHGWIVLAAYGDWNGGEYPLLLVKAGRVGTEGIEPGATYRLSVAGEFKRAE
jgi:hypothetical protein